MHEVKIPFHFYNTRRHQKKRNISKLLKFNFSFLKNAFSFHVNKCNLSSSPIPLLKIKNSLKYKSKFSIKGQLCQYRHLGRFLECWDNYNIGFLFSRGMDKNLLLHSVMRYLSTFSALEMQGEPASAA